MVELIKIQKKREWRRKASLATEVKRFTGKRVSKFQPPTIEPRIKPLLSK